MSAPALPPLGLDLFRLDGQVAIITGGAGAIGSQLARGFVAVGAAAQIAGEPDFYVAFKAKHPIGRFAQAEEMVGPTIFLCSPAASFITGHTLPVDGGYVAQ